MANSVLRFDGRGAGFFTLWLQLMLAAGVSSFSCPPGPRPCNELVHCRGIDTSNCAYGKVKDLCACCTVCANEPGQYCGKYDGECGDGLECSFDHYEGDLSEIPSDYPGICTEMEATTGAATTGAATASTTATTTEARTTSDVPTTIVSTTIVSTTIVSTTIAETEPSPSTQRLVEAEPNATADQPAVGCSQQAASQHDSLQVEVEENCRDECSVGFCSSSRHKLCSAKGMTLSRVAERGACQHTSCRACFLHVETPCTMACPKKACYKIYSNCIRNYIFAIGPILNLEDPRALLHTGRIVCHVPQLTPAT